MSAPSHIRTGAATVLTVVAFGAGAAALAPAASAALSTVAHPAQTHA
jgi:hypothetical protein